MSNEETKSKMSTKKKILIGAICLIGALGAAGFALGNKTRGE